MKYVIDTHALIWFLEGNPRLGQNAKVVMADVCHQLVLPAIALAEASWIIEWGRTSIPSVASLFTVVRTDPRVVIFPLDIDVIHQTLSLSSIHEMHDRQIVATALFLQTSGESVSLLTCDRNMIASGLVPTLW